MVWVGNKRVHTIPKSIRPKENIIEQLEFKLFYFMVALWPFMLVGNLPLSMYVCLCIYIYIYCCIIMIRKRYKVK